MQTLSQLKAMHEQMAGELARLPQYRALKAMDRFLAELAQIYNLEPIAAEKEEESLREKTKLAIENRVTAEPHPGTFRVTPYIPGNRVA